MRQVCKAPHAVNEIHRLLRCEKRRDAARDEQPDYLTFERLDLLARDRKLWCDSHERQGAFHCVVVRQRDAVEPALVGAVDQLLERALAVVREMGVEMKVDAQC